jgi:DNA-binding CsgD family transcriptional regulator
MVRRERARSRCRERLVALVDATLDPEEARRAAIEELRRAVGFDRWCWPLTDPASALSTGGIGEVDFWPVLPRLVALEEHGDVTRKPQLVVGRRASAALSSATGGDLARSRRWRECLSPYGIGDELMTACRDAHGCWGSVELMRDREDGMFDEADTEFLDDLAPTLGALLRKALAREERSRDKRTRPPAPATLIVDSELRPVGWTVAFAEWLGHLPGVQPGLLPPAVYELGVRALTPPHARTGLPASVRIPTLGGGRSVIEASPLEGAERASVAITIRAASVHETFDVLCRTYELTRRERQLAALILEGLATKEVAHALHISSYTVQDHLKAIFAKTGTRSRRELVSHLARSEG